MDLDLIFIIKSFIRSKSTFNDSLNNKLSWILDVVMDSI